jgi:hypothetical protein
VLRLETAGGLLHQQLVAETRLPSARFGAALAVSGDRAVVGAPGERAAHVFVRIGESWQYETKLFSGDDAIGAFGQAVAADGALVVVGGPIPASFGEGAAYVFRLAGGVWEQAARLVQIDGGDDQSFGSAVAVKAGRASVGAPKTAEGGAVYVFGPDADGWRFQARLTPQGGPSLFGAAVSLGREAVLIGAPESDIDGVGADAGLAYVHFLRSQDCDGHGRPDECHVGDLDSDGRVGPLETEAMTTCLRGPCAGHDCPAVDIGVCCHLLDLDADFDLDLADFAGFQRRFDSPEP